MIHYQSRLVAALHTLCLATALYGCSSLQSNTALYDQIGGQATLNAIADNFINEIAYDKQMMAFFAETNVERFRDKFVEHLCTVTDGPCTYSGDSMQQIHKGMNITERDFNRAVELLIIAMTNANVSVANQNRILKKLAELRKEIIYL
ncbi:MAG: group 1 truncated hemoglobin [Hahellaceae bacterium]|nr:group 1 truncated hemoglobin [Hahellaceae bacterium]